MAVPRSRRQSLRMRRSFSRLVLLCNLRIKALSSLFLVLRLTVLTSHELRLCETPRPALAHKRRFPGFPQLTAGPVGICGFRALIDFRIKRSLGQAVALSISGLGCFPSLGTEIEE